MDTEDKNVKIPGTAHRLLGVLRALEGREMRDIAAQAIEEYAALHQPAAASMMDELNNGDATD